MWRVHLSRMANYYLLNGRRGEMVSTRCEREGRVFYRSIINWTFFILRGEIGHCANMQVIDETQQSATGPEEETPLPQ